MQIINVVISMHWKLVHLAGISEKSQDIPSLIEIFIIKYFLGHKMIHKIKNQLNMQMQITISAKHHLLLLILNYTHKKSFRKKGHYWIAVLKVANHIYWRLRFKSIQTNLTKNIFIPSEHKPDRRSAVTIIMCR